MMYKVGCAQVTPSCDHYVTSIHMLSYHAPVKVHAKKVHVNISTVYQRTPDIAISEVCIFLQGSRTQSVFLYFFLELCEFSVRAYISQSADILIYFHDYNK